MAGDWLRKMAREVRGHGEELPIEAFLPALKAGHLGTTRPVPEPGLPPGLPHEDDPALGAPDEPAVEGMGVPFSEREDAGPRRRTRRRPAPEEKPRDLDAEIREFMTKDQRGASDEDDFSEFLGPGMDPNLDD